MSKDWYQDIVDFHREVVKMKIPTKINVISLNRAELRKSLITEEVLKETITAINNDDIVGIADGITDSIVVLLGTAVEYGIDIRPIWDEVHRSNMAKKDGPVRADGKVLKPAGWKAPDVRGELEKQGFKSEI